MTRALKIGGGIGLVCVFAAVGGFLWASSDVLPESELDKKETYGTGYASADRDTFTVMTYNLNRLQRGASGVSTPHSDSSVAANLNRATNLIRRVNPDILGIQNVGMGSARLGINHQFDTLASRLGIPDALRSVRWNERYYVSLLEPATSGPIVSGQALLSRFSIRRYLRKDLARPPEPFWADAFAPNPLVQIAAVDIGGWPLLVMNVHLEAIHAETREKQARTIKDLYGRLIQQGFPVLVIGTFNSFMPSKALSSSVGNRQPLAEDETMSILLDETSLQTAFSSGAAQMSGRSIGTYPANNPNRKLDYILYRPRFVIPVNTEILCGTPPPSNHCAVAMSFLLPRPKDELPDERIPDEQLPSLERFLGDESAN